MTDSTADAADDQATDTRPAEGSAPGMPDAVDALGEDVLVHGDSAMAAGDGGLLAVIEGSLGEVEPWSVLRSVRLDADGRALPSSPRLLISDLAAPHLPPAFDVAWGAGGFGVLCGAGTTSSDGLHIALFFRFLRPVVGPSP